MLAFNLADDKSASVFRAGVLKSMNDSGDPMNVSSAISLVRADGVPIYGQAVFQETRLAENNRPSAFVPRTLILDCGSLGWLVFILGVSDQSGARFYLKTITDPSDGSFLNFSPVLVSNRRAASYINANFFSGSPWPQRVVMAGHSVGGAVAYWLQAFPLERNGSNSRVTVTTFGSPRVARQNNQPTYVTSDSCHWMNSDDAVPHIPPALTDWQRWWAGFSTTQHENMSNWLRPARSADIDLSGEDSWRQLPSQTGDPVDAVRRWVSLGEQGVQTTHSLDAYIARLTLAGGRVSQADSPYIPGSRDTTSSGGGGSSEPSGTPTPAVADPLLTASEIRTIGASETQTIINNGNTQNSTPVVIPTLQWFNVYRSGRTYFVTLGLITVAAAPHKRGAHQLARLGNAFLRSLQNRAGVSTDDLLAAFTVYLEQASDPTAGFQPVMADSVN